MTSRTFVLSSVACILAGVSSLQAQVGTSGMAFLKLGVSGRGVSLGDAMSALASGPAATYYNPAGILSADTGSEATQIMFMHKEWIQDTRTEFLGSSIPLGVHDALGVSVNSTTVSDIEIRTVPGPPDGTFTARNFSFGLSYARGFSENVRIGVTAKFLYEKILLNEATGYALDAGAQIATPVEHLTAGVAVANVGSMSKLGSEKTALPALLRVGPAYGIELGKSDYTLNVAADLEHIFPEKRSYVNAGTEFVFSQLVAARAGYQFGSEGRGLTAGLGVSYGMFTLDYAFARLAVDLGDTHTFSLALSF